MPARITAAICRRHRTIKLTRRARDTGLKPNAAANNTVDALYQLHLDANRSLVSRQWPFLFMANPKWISRGPQYRDAKQ